MSQYVENHLGRGEKIVLKAEKNILYLLLPFLWMLLVLVGAAVAQVFINDKLAVLEDSSQFTKTMNLVSTIVVWVAFALIGILPFARALLTFLSLNLALTNKRVVGKVGILSIVTVDITIDKIDHVTVSAGVFGNLLKYYALAVVSVGGSGADLGASRKGNPTFIAIKNAQQFKDAVTLAVEQHAEEARVAQAEAIARAMGGNTAR